jgi:hypothetical protein
MNESDVKRSIIIAVLLICIVLAFIVVPKSTPKSFEEDGHKFKWSNKLEQYIHDPDCPCIQDKIDASVDSLMKYD